VDLLDLFNAQQNILIVFLAENKEIVENTNGKDVD
jgi:hypothetical protein